LRLPLKRALKLIAKAQEEDTREYAFKIYLAALPNMTEENKMTFNEFWEEIKPEKITYDTRSQEEIISDVMEIEKKFRKEE
jgi:hypothetical protein